MRGSAVPLPLPPDHDYVPVPSSFSVAPPTATAVIGGHHCSLVIVRLSQTIVVIFLVLLLLQTKRMPIPDCDTHPRRATYKDDGNPCAQAIVVVSPASRTTHVDPPPSYVGL
jgi:hypothetical protein